MPRRSVLSPEEETEINLSPMIDCIFILLIFFIVTTVFIEEPGVEVFKPDATVDADLEKNSIIIALTDAGEVGYGGRDIGVGNIQSLVRRLCQAEKLPVIIRPDRNAPSGILVRIIDEAKLAGALKVSLSTEINRS